MLFCGICFFVWETKIDFKDIALLMLLVEDLEGRRRGPWLSCRSRRGASIASTSARPPDHQIQDGKGEENSRAETLNNVRDNKAKRSSQLGGRRKWKEKLKFLRMETRE